MRTLNGEVLIDNKGNFNEELWLENAIAIYQLLSGEQEGDEVDEP